MIKKTGVSDYQKIRSIYDYLTSNIKYDYANLKNDKYIKKYTAYAGLIKKTCVCQGYSLCFYRLALEVGLDAVGNSMDFGRVAPFFQLFAHEPRRHVDVSETIVDFIPENSV